MVMSEWHRCPNCAYPLSLPQPAGKGVSTEVVEALLAEIQRLRETVATLRGTSCRDAAEPQPRVRVTV
jgi:hypothetical protein